MPFRKGAIYGAYFASHFGYNSDESLGDKLKTLNDAAISNCMLAAVLQELQAIRREPAKPHPASGMVVGWRALTGDFPLNMIPAPSFSALSSKALNVLRRAPTGASIKWLTTENLRSLYGCGPKTANEIIDWAANIIGRREKETPSCELAAG